MRIFLINNLRNQTFTYFNSLFFGKKAKKKIKFNKSNVKKNGGYLSASTPFAWLKLRNTTARKYIPIKIKKNFRTKAIKKIKMVNSINVLSALHIA